MKKILEELKRVRYLRHVVLALARADQEQYEEVKSMLFDLPQDVTILWIDGDRIQALFQMLEEHGLSARRRR